MTTLGRIIDGIILVGLIGGLWMIFGESWVAQHWQDREFSRAERARRSLGIIYESGAVNEERIEAQIGRALNRPYDWRTDGDSS